MNEEFKKKFDLIGYDIARNSIDFIINEIENKFFEKISDADTCHPSDVYQTLIQIISFISVDSIRLIYEHYHILTKNKLSLEDFINLYEVYFKSYRESYIEYFKKNPNKDNH